MERYGRIVKRKRNRSYSSRKRTSTYRATRSAIYNAIETKHKRVTVPSFANIGSVQGTLINLTEFSKGTGSADRIGNKIQLTRVVGTFDVGESQAGGFTDGDPLQIRCMIVQSRGGPLTTSDMPGLSGGNQVEKYYVLKDWYINPKFSCAWNGASVRKYIGVTTSYVNIKPIWKQVTFVDNLDTPQDHPMYVYLFAENASLEQKHKFNVFFKDG